MSGAEVSEIRVGADEGSSIVGGMRKSRMIEWWGGYGNGDTVEEGYGGIQSKLDNVSGEGSWNGPRRACQSLKKREK